MKVGDVYVGRGLHFPSYKVPYFFAVTFSGKEEVGNRPVPKTSHINFMKMKCH